MKVCALLIDAYDLESISDCSRTASKLLKLPVIAVTAKDPVPAYLMTTNDFIRSVSRIERYWNFADHSCVSYRHLSNPVDLVKKGMHLAVALDYDLVICLNGRINLTTSELIDSSISELSQRGFMSMFFKTNEYSLEGGMFVTDPRHYLAITENVVVDCSFDEYLWRAFATDPYSKKDSWKTLINGVVGSTFETLYDNVHLMRNEKNDLIFFAQAGPLPTKFAFEFVVDNERSREEATLNKQSFYYREFRFDSYDDSLMIQAVKFENNGYAKHRTFSVKKQHIHKSDKVTGIWNQK